MGPRLIRGVARLLIGLFYRRVEAVGLDRVPSRGALVLAANHQNALVDPLLLLATIPRLLRPIAKAPLFRHPVLGPLLRLARALPAHRRQDPGSDPTLNAATFRAVADAFQAGEAILIFPEGVSQPAPKLMPLRTGVARMLLGADRPTASPPPDRAPAALVPVGLLVHEPGTFRVGWAHVRVGEPVATADCLERARTEPEAAVRALTDRLAVALRGLVVEAEDHDTLRLARALEAIWRAEASAGRGGSGAPPAHDGGAWLRQAMHAYRYLLTREPVRVARLRGDVARYLADLERLGLTHDQLTRVYPASVVARYALREGLALLGGLPLALWGLASHAVPYWLTALAIRTIRPERDSEATMKLGVGILVYPLCWALEGWVLGRVLGGVALAAFVLLLVPTGLFALSWQERLARVRRDARGFLRFLGDRDLLARLAARRRALADEASALSRGVPAAVLAGAAEAAPAHDTARPRASAS